MYFGSSSKPSQRRLRALGHCTRSYCSGEGVEHKVAGVGQKLDEEFRQGRRETRRVWLRASLPAQTDVVGVALVVPALDEFAGIEPPWSVNLSVMLWPLGRSFAR